MFGNSRLKDEHVFWEHHLIGKYWLLLCEGKVLWPHIFKEKIMPGEEMCSGKIS
jgi:hypothetical protein